MFWWCPLLINYQVSIFSGLQLQRRHTRLFLHHFYFFLKHWYVMFLFSVYSSSNSLRTLILKETNRHFSFSVFLFCCHILPSLFLGKRSADFLFIWNQTFWGWNCLFCLQAERWKHLYLSMNKEDYAYIYTSEHCIIWAFHLFFLK